MLCEIFFLSRSAPWVNLKAEGIRTGTSGGSSDGELGIFLLGFYCLWIVDSYRSVCYLFILESEYPINYNISVPNNKHMPYVSVPIEAT